MNGLVSGKRIERDVVKQPIIPSCILANKSGKKLGVLIIDEKTLTVKVSLEDSYILLAEMSCDVHKYINTVKILSGIRLKILNYYIYQSMYRILNQEDYGLKSL